MLYAVHGSETDKARAKKDALVASCQKQRPDAEFFVIENDNFSEGALESLYSSQGLFVKKHIVVLDRVFPKKRTKSEEPDDVKKEIKDVIKETVLSALPKMAVSESVFILFEETLDAKTLAEVKKHANNIFAFGDKKEKKEWNNTTFDISDKFAMKDKRGAWVCYQKAIRQGIAPEAIYGAIFSGVKTILLTKKTKSAEEAGIKPYSYDKAKNSAKNYTEDELSAILTNLNRLYHGIRSEGGELEIELEKFILGK